MAEKVDFVNRVFKLKFHLVCKQVKWNDFIWFSRPKLVTKKKPASKMVRYKTDRNAKMWKYSCNSIWWNRRQKNNHNIFGTNSIKSRIECDMPTKYIHKWSKRKNEINHQIETMYDHLERHHKKLALRHDWQQSTWFERCLFFALDAFNNTSTT